VVNDLYSNPAGFRFVKWAGGVAVERCPGILVDLYLEGGLECLVGVVCPQEVGVANEETLFVVVSVYVNL
jgi:hypothetical protein